MLFLPKFEVVMSDNDKLQPMLSSILGQLIVPNLKFVVKSQLLGILAMLGLKYLCIQRGLAKYWKRDFWDTIFMDNQFFSYSLSMFVVLECHMKEYLLSEPEKISELVAKIPSSGSSNLFLSREMESMNRAIMIRRLSFVAYCVDVDILKANMPIVQEKTVDILRLGHGASCAEIFLLLRVVLYRLGDEMPSTLWPVVVTELLTIYKNLLRETNTSSFSGSQPTLAQASRLVDLVILTGYATPLLYLNLRSILI